ncbi:MAG: PAS domain S-box protein [Limnoraphis robusta]
MKPNQPFLAYGVALCLTAIALLLALWLKPFLSPIISPLFYIAIIISSWYGGLRPGIVAVFLSTLAISYFFLVPLDHNWITNPQDLLQLILFLTVGMVINLVTGNLQNSKKKVERLSKQLAQKNAEQLRMALSAAQMGVWDWNLVTGEIKWSPEHEHLLGLTPGTFDGKYETFDQCLHPDDRPGLNQAVQQALQTRSTYNHEYRVIWPDSSIHWIEGRGQAFYNTIGQAVRMSGTILNINERKQAQIRQQQQFEQQRLILDMTQRIRRSLNLQDILQTTVDEVREFLQVDRVIIFQFGVNWGGTVEVESVVDKTMAIVPFDIYDPCIGEKYVEPFKQGLVTAKSDIYKADISPCHIEFLAQFKIRANLVVPILKDDELWGLLAAHHCRSPRLWQDSEIDLLKQIASVVSIALQQSDLFEQVQTELTERKRAEIALQQLNSELEQRVIERTIQLTKLNARLLVTLEEQEQASQLLTEQAELLDLAHDSIITWNLNSEITFWNQGSEFLYGWTKAEALGQETHTLLKTQFDQPLAEIQTQLLEQGCWEGELIHFTKDNRPITVLSRWVLQKDNTGEPIKILEINNDISERKQAEFALQQYSREVEDLYNNAPCGYHSLDEAGTIVRINDTELNWLGYTRQEILHKIKFFDLITAASQQVFQKNFNCFKQQGVINNIEFELITKAGNILWVTVNATAIKDQAGNYLMSRSTVFDISERKQTEIILQQQARQEQLLFSVTQAIRQSLDLNVILNTAVTEVRQTLQTDRAVVYRFNLDWSGDFIVESVGENWVKLVEDGVIKVWEDTYLQDSQGGRFRNKESFVICDIYRAELLPCHIELLEQFQAKSYVAVPIFSGENLWGLFAIYKNSSPRKWQSWEVELLEKIGNQLAIAIQQSELYTQLQIELYERKQATAILRESERRWRSLLDHVQLIVVELDLQGSINYVNPFFLNITGYTHAEVIGKNWFKNFFRDLEQQRLQTIFSEILTQNAHPYYQNSILSKSGEEKFIAWNNTRLQDSQGKVIGTISIGEDITERQKIEQIKDEFIGIVSHELRTPLTAIQMSLGLLKTGIYDKKPDKFRRMIEIALIDTNRLVNLVNDILDLERLESGRTILEKTIFKAADLIQQAIDGIQAIATQQQITLTFTPTDAEVWAAPDAIIQTLTNLLSNAIKFSPAQSTIHLTAESQIDCVLFKVSDQGRGIPADKLETIFGRFQQVDASDSREKGGTGLGLTICQSIIERHDGKIWVESRLGVGSTFFFTLPLPLENIR